MVEVGIRPELHVGPHQQQVAAVCLPQSQSITWSDSPGSHIVIVNANENMMSVMGSYLLDIFNTITT